MVQKKKQQVCMLCAKPSVKSICDNCADNVRGEAHNKNKKTPKK